MTSPRFSRSVGVTVATQVTLAVVRTATMAVVARALGPAGQGQVALALLVPATIMLLLEAGLPVANVHFLGSRRLSEAHVVGVSLVWSLVIGGVAAVLVIAAAPGPLAAVVPGLPVAAAVVAAWMIPTTLLMNTMRAVLHGHERLLAVNALDVVHAVATLALVAFAVVIVDGSVQDATMAYVLATAGAGVVAVVAVWRFRSLRPRFAREPARQILGFGLRSSAANIFQFLALRLDVFLLNLFVTSSAVGLYVVAARLAEILWMVPTAASFVILPRAAARSTQEMNAFTPRAFWATASACALVATAVGMLSPLLVRVLFGEEYRAAIAPFLALLPGVALLGPGMVLANEIAGRGRPNLNVVNSGVGLVAVVVFDVLLIPAWGAVGAGVASSIAYTINSVLAVVFYLRVSATDPRDFVAALPWWRGWNLFGRPPSYS
ncbi:MAG TPA: oligosaccharide flippase family protein [Acidimicrobiales bacterium]|nr:oligosaccharide flippase family protein [Acidimicrobiales bacterium]